MTLRKRIEGLLANAPRLATFTWDAWWNVDEARLSMEGRSGSVSHIVEKIDIGGSPGDDLDLNLLVSLEMTHEGEKRTIEERMTLIPTKRVEQITTLIHKLRQAISLEALLEDELGKERAAEICAALDRDLERQEWES